MWALWYKILSPSKTAVMYSSLFVAILSLCLVIHRWCGIVDRVKHRTVYTVLQYTAWVVMIVAFVAVGSSLIAPFIVHGKAYENFRVIVNDFVLQPLLLIFTLTFCVVCTSIFV
jgi:hypothetical protein